MSAAKPAVVRVQRYNLATDGAPEEDTYELELPEPMSVLNVLRLIHQQQDASLAFRDFDCYRGVCLACHMEINGKKQRACSCVVNPGDQIEIRPLPGEEVVRDLVTVPSDNDSEE